MFYWLFIADAKPFKPKIVSSVRKMNVRAKSFNCFALIFIFGEMLVKRTRNWCESGPDSITHTCNNIACSSFCNCLYINVAIIYNARLRPKLHSLLLVPLRIMIIRKHQRQKKKDTVHIVASFTVREGMARFTMILIPISVIYTKLVP